jgi:hypothetical protein
MYNECSTQQKNMCRPKKSKKNNGKGREEALEII